MPDARRLYGHYLIRPDRRPDRGPSRHRSSRCGRGAADVGDGLADADALRDAAERGAPVLVVGASGCGRPSTGAARSPFGAAGDRHLLGRKPATGGGARRNRYRLSGATICRRQFARQATDRAWRPRSTRSAAQAGKPAGRRCDEGGTLVGYGFQDFLESGAPPAEAGKAMDRFGHTWNEDGQRDGTEPPYPVLRHSRSPRSRIPTTIAPMPNTSSG